MRTKKKLHYFLPTLIVVIAFYPVHLAVVFLLDHFIGGQTLWQAFWFESWRDVLFQLKNDWLHSAPLNLAVAGFVVLPSVHLMLSGRRQALYLFVALLLLALGLVLGLLGATVWQIISALSVLLFLVLIAQLSLRTLHSTHD